MFGSASVSETRAKLPTQNAFIQDDKTSRLGQLAPNSLISDLTTARSGHTATRLANGPSLAIGIMRQNIATALEMDYASALLREAEGQRIAGASADAKEGGLSFLEKRKPVFTGK